MDTTGATPVQARCVGDTAIIYASDYLNKLSGERIERECKRQLEAGRQAVVINFRDTELVNSIGVSILMGLIDAAEQSQARLIFSDVNSQTVSLFEMLGLTRHVQIAKDENEALSWIEPQAKAVSEARP
ncbi:MAG TPA: STAS domain-containing protein [Pyrinomonadaceae bacterium]|jgi:anti-anti-sigma factor|nr:STAS domain-containing protein [Pyrinomonadaceae bacterium]